ncbi:hypothetical protein ACHAWF_006181 [Thalassiosira exigua]
MNRALRGAAAVAALSLFGGRTESFTSRPVPSRLPTRCDPRPMPRPLRCDCCEHCNATSPGDGYERRPALVEVPSIPIHTSRRDFIRCATSASLATAAGVSMSPADANAANDASSFIAQDKKDVIIPGPLAPFSTTRTYRNIVLGNGLKVMLVQDSMVQQSSVALSIDGAGQFSEPAEVPGLAHLMEHVVLSSTRRVRHGKPDVLDRKARRLWNNGSKAKGSEREVDSRAARSGEEDFEDWITNVEGDSNGFTAPGFVCFHFNCPHEILPEGLERFSRLFTLDEVETTIAQKPYVIPREIERVTDELDRTGDASRAFYFLKSNVNPEHPFARFSAGSKKTLQTIPDEQGIDVASELLLFFRDHYLASKATLVVVGKAELGALDRWISPFSNVMSQRVARARSALDGPTFPDPMLGNVASSNAMKQTIILRSKDDAQVDENIQTLCIEWPLSLVYYRQTNLQNIITAPALGFVLTQMLSRRGPGSLRYFFEKFGWAAKGGSNGVPRISFPVDTTGFQILRMEIGLTLDGFANRSAVLGAVFESIRKVIETPLQLDLIKQYLAAGLLHGYLFAPRPPDAITLAVDSLRFGTSAIGSDNFNWYLMPGPEDVVGVENMRQAVTDVLRLMSDDKTPLVSFRASPKAVFTSSGGIIDQSISTPPVFSPWKVEPITGARYYVESRVNGGSSYFKSLLWFASRFDGESLRPPYLNPLIPTKFRAPRPVIERQASWGGSRYFYLEDASAFEGSTRSTSGSLKLSNVGTWRQLQAISGDEGSNWKLWHIPPAKQKLIGLPLPMRPPEPSMECAFVVQLLSSLPSTFTRSQLTLANLWLLSFDEEILDLAELGATAGIAYETSLNTAGLRICFRGVSQTLPSYVRRFLRRLVQYHSKLLDGSTKVKASVYQRAISEANRSPKINRLQKQQIIDTTQQVSDKDIARQGLFFLKCTSGLTLISQGDVLPNESLKLLGDLQQIFKGFCNADGFLVEPDLRNFLYRPFWKPRDASPCLLPGLSLISDSCGRIPR